MNGAHDLGGMHGFGPVAPESDEPVFHDEWERRCFALTLASGFLGRWNLDMSRYARERLHPARYLSTSYYEHWLHGLELLLVERGLLSEIELQDGGARGRADPDLHALEAAGVDAALARGGSARVEETIAARFGAGDEVGVRNLNPCGHTRMPRYVRGRRGTVHLDHGVFVFPDHHAAGAGENPQHVYCVRFEGDELWGADASTVDAVYVDLWESYLEPAHQRIGNAAVA